MSPNRLRKVQGVFALHPVFGYAKIKSWFVDGEIIIGHYQHISKYLMCFGQV